MRWRRVVLSLPFALAASRPVGADEPPLLLFHAPPDAPGEVAVARAALEAVARRRASALIDLSPAADAPPEAASHLARAIEAYTAFRYDEARGHAERGIGEAQASGASGLSPRELSDLFLYRAMASAAAGDKLGAWDDFVRAAAVDPTRQLDPARFQPSVMRSFSRAAREVQAGGHAELTVNAPAGCSARVDGRDLALGAAIRTAWGAHFVRVSCPGHLPFAGQVMVQGQRHAIEPSLVPHDRPDAARASEAAAARGARRAILATARLGGGAPPGLVLELVDVATRRAGARRFVRLDRESGPAVEAAAEALIDRADRAARPVVPAPRVVTRVVEVERPWYRNPWLWGAVGVAAAAAIAIPFAFGGDEAGPSGFDVELDNLP